MADKKISELSTHPSGTNVNPTNNAWLEFVSNNTNYRVSAQDLLSIASRNSEIGPLPRVSVARHPFIPTHNAGYGVFNNDSLMYNSFVEGYCLGYFRRPIIPVAVYGYIQSAVEVRICWLA
jgi:hypothetical protein